MEAINNVGDLDRRIAYLQQQQNFEKNAIVAEFAELKERIKPANLLRSFIGSVRHSPEVRADILHGAVGLATGFLTNKMLLSKFHGPWKRIIALLVQAGIVNVAVKYPDAIKSKVIGVVTRFLQSIKLKDGDEEHAAAPTNLQQ